MIHFYMFHGSLSQGGSWGGEACRAFMPFTELVGESVFWTAAALFYLNKVGGFGVLSALYSSVNRDKVVAQRPFAQFVFDRILGSLMLTIFMFLIYYKSNVFALCTLLQPCHLILLTQSLALVSDGGGSVLLSAMQLPLMSHTLALFFPDTTGLDQPLEEDMYWYQHYLTAVVPLWLLMRNNYQVFKAITDNFSAIFGVMLAMVVLLHFGFYSPLDFMFKVNVQFMLCPGDGMRAPLAAAPQWLQWPTYRSILCVLSGLMSLVYTLVMLALVKMWQWMVGAAPLFKSTSSDSSKLKKS